MTSLRVKVTVTEDNTDEVIADTRRALEAGIAASVPGVVSLAQRYVRHYSSRVAAGIKAYQVGPATWLIRGEHHASHIVESGARHVAARPFLVPALMNFRGQIAKNIHRQTRS